jgi:hypothetical protein
MSQNIVIVGAGLAGLLAACHFKDSVIIDRMPAPTENHTALLRFRSTAVSELTGIPFKKVRVQKAVYSGDRVMSYASIRDQNLYSLKVSGGVSARSIANLDPCERWVAPDDFYQHLVSKHKDRISWGVEIGEAVGNESTIVSTAPMSVNLAATGMESTFAVPFKFDKSAIQVSRYKLAAPSDVYQTVYFPDPDLNIFRASITGDNLIIEALCDGNGANSSDLNLDDLNVALYSFGLEMKDLDIASFSFNIQNFGKMVDMPKADREAIMFELTHAHNLFSLGRFATWRNILLDDVVSDIKTIDRLISASAYSRRLIALK